MKKETLILFLLATVQFTHIVDFMILMPMSPLLIKEWGIESMDFNLVVASYSFFAFISSLISAKFMNNLNLKRVLIMSYLGFIIGTGLCGMVDSYEMFMLSRTIAGTFGGVLAALILAIVGKVIPNERRAKGVGIVMIGFSAAAALGVPLGFYLAYAFDWQTPFLGLAGFSTVVLLISIKYIPAIGKISEESLSFRQVYISPFKSKNQIYAMLLTILLIFGQFTMIPTINQYFVFNLGYPEQNITYIYLVGGVISVVTGPLIGRLADKYGRYRTFVIFMLLSCIPIWLLTNMTTNATWAIVTVTTLFFIFIGGRMIPATAMMTSAATARERGSFMSISIAVRQMASFVSPLIAGMVLLNTPDKQVINYDIVGYMAIGFSLLSLLVAKKIKIADQ